MNLHFPKTIQKDQSRGKKIRVGIIGYGYWGPKLVRNFHDLADADLVMVSDLRQERLAEIKERYPEVNTTQNYKELINGEIDAVVVATPVHTHFNLAKAALLAGKHVFVEKPITSQSSQAKELISLAEEKGLTLMVGHTFVFNPAVQAVREIVDSGQLGQIYYMDCVRVNLGLLQPDINVMWDLAPHDLSILRYLLSQDPIRVSGRGNNYINKVTQLFEVAYITLVFPNDVMATLRLSWLDPVKQRRLTIVGSEKMLVYDDIADNKVVIYDKGVEVPSYSVTEKEFHASYRHGDEMNYSIEWIEPLSVECNHFIESIRHCLQPLSSGIDGLRVLQVMETAQRSLVNGGVELKIEYGE